MSELDQMRYDFLTHLFGLSLDKEFVRRKYAGRFERCLWREIALFRAIGALRDTGPRLELTERGMYYWVVMMREFFTGVNRFRDQMRRYIRSELGAAQTDDAPAPRRGAVRRTILRCGMEDDRIGLAHGNGGRFMRELIAEVFLRHLGNPALDADADAVPLALNGGEVMLTTDGFTVQPLEFPGGTIGSLAVHGTVNDLAVTGATALYMSLGVIIEEGFEIKTLERIVRESRCSRA